MPGEKHGRRGPSRSSPSHARLPTRRHPASPSRRRAAPSPPRRPGHDGHHEPSVAASRLPVCWASRGSLAARPPMRGKQAPGACSPARAVAGAEADLAAAADEVERSCKARARFCIARAERERSGRSRSWSPSLSLQPQPGGGGHHRRAARVHRRDDLLGVDVLQIDAAPRGAMREEMTDDNISSVLAGMPALG
jgi:hypothetical protein